MDIAPLPAPLSAVDYEALCALLRACVESGASIGFVLPLTQAEVDAYWIRISGDLATGHRLLWVARNPAGHIVGAAQLACESRANGRHRAEIQKVMVLPSHRRRGIAAQLMAALEFAALSRAVTLLFLDTSDGPGGARAFYEALGYTYAGGIPGYAVDPDGTPCANAIFYKTLGARG